MAGSGSTVLLVILLHVIVVQLGSGLLSHHPLESTVTHERQLTVHVVFSNHLDVGYTALDNEVINLYFNTHFPRAIRLAQEMRRDPGQGAFIYTTHSFLISLFLSCPTGMGLECPSAYAVEDLCAAIRRGDITWHGFPFNSQAEMYEPWLYEASIGLSHSLDDEFGIPRKVAMSQRDIPGITRGVIPILSRTGIRMLSVGVNAATAPPAVPHMTPFVWRDPASGAKILAMWHPGGYGGSIPGSGFIGGLDVDSRSDCIITPGNFSHVLCVAWREDNQGPPQSLFEIGRVIQHLRDQFPAYADVRASTLDNYADALWQAMPDLNLPVFEGEIGDTWIHGQGSDPGRMADFRAAMRAGRACLASGECQQDEPNFRNFTRLLSKIGEHTWGLAIQQLDDWWSWTNEQLHAALSERRPTYELLVGSWRRQTQYVEWAIQALGEEHPVTVAYRADRADRKASVIPPPPAATSSPRDTPAPSRRRLNHASIASSSSGSISSSSSMGRRKGSNEQLGRANSKGISGGSGSSNRDRDAVHAGADSSLSLHLNKHDLQQRLATSSTGQQKSPDGGGAEEDLTKLSFETKLWAVTLDLKTGTLSRLARRSPATAADPAGAGSCQEDGHNWAGHGSQFGLPVYSTYTEDDFFEMLGRYSYQYPYWESDFSKYNCSSAKPVSANLSGKLQTVQLSHPQTTAARAGGRPSSMGAPLTHVTLSLEFVFDEWARRAAGAPASVWLVYRFPDSISQSPAAADPPAAATSVQLDVVLVDKTATRLPEALWLKIRPGMHAADHRSWRMSKLESQVSPLEVVFNGSQSLHGVWDEGVSVHAPLLHGEGVQPGGTSARPSNCRGGFEDPVLRIRSLDAAMLSAGEPTALPNPDRKPHMESGISFNLLNNVWGTNFVMWYPYEGCTDDSGEGIKFRFLLDVEEATEKAGAASMAVSQ